VFVPVRDDHAARSETAQDTLKLASHVTESRVDEQSMHEVRAHVVSHRRRAPGPHAHALHVAESRELDHRSFRGRRPVQKKSATKTTIMPAIQSAITPMVTWETSLSVCDCAVSAGARWSSACVGG